MSRIQTAIVSLSLGAAAFTAGTVSAAETATPPAAARTASPAPDAAKAATKTRSNIQNNREAAPPATTTDPATEPEQVVKTKTKSNQSND